MRINKVDVAATAKNLRRIASSSNLGDTEQNNMDCVPSILPSCCGNSDTINDELTFQNGPNTPLTDGQSATGTPDSNVHGAKSSQLDEFSISL